ARPGPASTGRAGARCPARCCRTTPGSPTGWPAWPTPIPTQPSARSALAGVGRAACERGDTKWADSTIGRLDPLSEEATAEGVSSILENVRSYLHGVSALAAGDPARASGLLA